MKKMMAGWLAVVTLVSASSLLAHHSFSTVFDLKQTSNITGAVTKVVWQNPHPWIYVDVKGDRDVTTRWAVQASSNIRLLEQYGLSATTLKNGDTVSVCGYVGKPGVNDGTDDVPVGFLLSM